MELPTSRKDKFHLDNTIEKKGLQIWNKFPNKTKNKFPPLPVLAEAGNGINLVFEVEYETLPVLRTARWNWSGIICIR